MNNLISKKPKYNYWFGKYKLEIANNKNYDIWTFSSWLYPEFFISKVDLITVVFYSPQYVFNYRKYLLKNKYFLYFTLYVGVINIPWISCVWRRYKQFKYK